MDAMVQTREAEHGIGIESRFLTTYMLPKLAKLHDRGQLVFLMATNFQASFDPAIKRAGRFDFLLCMGPPTLKEKCDSLDKFFKSNEPADQIVAAADTIRRFARADQRLQDQLSLYTYDEFSAFLSGIGDSTAVRNCTAAELKDKEKKFSQGAYLKRADLEKLRKVPRLSNWKKLEDLDEVDFDEKLLKSKHIDVTIPAIKYFLDRKQSRRQCPTSHAKGQSGK